MHPGKVKIPVVYLHGVEMAKKGSQTYSDQRGEVGEVAVSRWHEHGDSD